MKNAVRIAGLVLLAESVVVLWYFGIAFGLFRHPGALMHGPTLGLACILLPLGALICGAVAALWPPATTAARSALFIAVSAWFLGLWSLVRAIVFMAHASPLISPEARPTWW
jgi:hypothetical protein